MLIFFLVRGILFLCFSSFVFLFYMFMQKPKAFFFFILSNCLSVMIINRTPKEQPALKKKDDELSGLIKFRIQLLIQQGFAWKGHERSQGVIKIFSVLIWMPFTQSVPMFLCTQDLCTFYKIYLIKIFLNKYRNSFIS